MRILIVEDDDRLADALASSLVRRDYVVDCVGTLGDARLALDLNPYSGVVLDRRLPDGNGIALLRDVHQISPRPGVIMLTAQSDTGDVVDGLNAGADDYLAKPFEVEVLVARLRALLRRPSPPVKRTTQIGMIMFDHDLRSVTVGGTTLTLPRRELVLLEVLMQRPGTVSTIARIESVLYGFDDNVQPNAIQPHVSRLRAKLRQAGAQATIIGLRGIGYLMRAEP